MDKNMLVCDQCGEAYGCQHSLDEDFNMEPRGDYEASMRRILIVFWVALGLCFGAVGWVWWG